MGALDRLEAFAGHHGADFYALPRNTRTLTLQKKPWVVPQTYNFGGELLIPLRAGETVPWSIV